MEIGELRKRIGELAFKLVVVYIELLEEQQAIAKLARKRSEETIGRKIEKFQSLKRQHGHRERSFQIAVCHRQSCQVVQLHKRRGQRLVEFVVVQIQTRETREVAQGGWNGTAQAIFKCVQDSQSRELPQGRWQLSFEQVVENVELLQRNHLTDRSWNCPRKAIVLQMKVFHESFVFQDCRPSSTKVVV